MRLAHNTILREEMKAFLQEHFTEKEAMNFFSDMGPPPKFEYKEGSNVAYFNGGVTNSLIDSCKSMLEDMKDHEEITINLNSIGGSATAGVAVATMLRDAEQKVNVNVLGMAYSAASVILQGADTRRVARGAIVGIHKASSFNYGDSDAMQWSANYLKTRDEGIMELYGSRVPEDKMEKVAELVKKDTAMTGKEAIELGLADEVMKAGEAKAIKKQYDKVKEEGKASIDKVDEEVQEKVDSKDADTAKKPKKGPVEKKPSRTYSLAELRFYEACRSTV